MEYLQSFLKFEAAFDHRPVLEWHNQHVEYPVFAVSIYLAFIFGVPGVLGQAYKLKWTMAAWNFLLSIFSIFGAIRMVPRLAGYLEGGFLNSMCTHIDYLSGPSGFWMMLFIYSKFFELIDTVFLVLNKRDVIFLHWFHHVTVLLYCWLSYGQAISTGIWFAAMNYCVHSIMYMYYGLMIFRSLRPLIQPIAPFITVIQISQMVGGMVVCTVAAYQRLVNGAAACNVQDSNWKLGLGMYICYFGLFCMLFKDKFLKSKPKNGKSGKDKESGICNATDASGMFRTASNAQIESNGSDKKRA